MWTFSSVMGTIFSMCGAGIHLKEGIHTCMFVERMW